MGLVKERKIINFDGRCLQDTGYRSSGIGKYAEWLFIKLLASPQFLVKFAAHQEDQYVASLLKKVEFETIPFCEMRSGIYFNPSLMTHNSEPLDLASARGLTRVGVVHDLIPLRRPDESSEYDLSLFKTMLGKSAELDVIVANSLCTMRDYRAWRKADVSLFVLHPESRFAACGPDVSHAKKAVQAILKIDSPYVFFAVADHPRKNIELAARAAPALQELGFATVVGGGISAATIERLSQSYDLSTITFTPRLSDPDLVSVYVAAEAVVIPSFDEGFSLPVFEAVNLGCRVLVSDIDAHREQVLDSKHFFKPDDLGDFLESFHATSSCESTNHVLFDHTKELASFLNRLDDCSS
jgi:glycosyltransferase involved in cell wall biosynthesis